MMMDYEFTLKHRIPRLLAIYHLLHTLYWLRIGSTFVYNIYEHYYLQCSVSLLIVLL